MDKYSNTSPYEERSLNAEEKAREKFDKLIGNDSTLNAMNQKISYLKHMETLKDIDSFNKIVDSALKGESPVKSTFELLKRQYEKEEAYGTFNSLKNESQRNKENMSIRELENLRDDYKMGILSGNITNPFEESLNRDKSGHIADYSMSAKWKDMGLRLASGIPQGLGLVGDYVANHMNSTGKYLFSDTDKNYNEIFAKEQAENNGFSKFANWMTSPLDEARAKINSQSLIGYDQLMDSYENEGLLDNLALTGSFALDLAPSLLETAIMAVPGVGTAKGLAALGATYLAETNKEEQGKKLGKTVNQIQGVENNTDILDIIGAAGQAAFAVPELAMLKYAGGLAKSPTKSVFDAINKTKAKQSVDEFVDNYALAPGKWLYKGAGLAARPTAALGSMAAMEAISEVGQESFKKVANEDWWNKSTAENLKDLKESAVLGAIGGATLGGGIRSVTAPIEYIGNKAKETEIFETTKERAKNISETLNINDSFSSSIKETTDSKGNTKKTREVENPLNTMAQEEVDLRNDIFYNLSQISLSEYDSVPDNNSEDSPLNVNKNVPLLNEVFSFGASGFLSPIQKDGRDVSSQEIIEESINRAKQAIREHIDSILDSNPNTDTDGVISTLAEFKEKTKNNPALDYYVARQMLTNTDQVSNLLAEAASKAKDITSTQSDTSVQNESEGQSLRSYENTSNSTLVSSAVSQGQKLAEQSNKATKAYTKEQLNNIKKAAKFISELTGIEELAANVDQKLNENSSSNTTSKNRASSAVSSMLNRINSIITALETPEDTREDFKTNAELNTSLGAILTGHTTFTGQRKDGLATILQNALTTINKVESIEGQKNQEIIKDIKSLKWWLNSHRAKYKMYKKVIKDLKEAEKNKKEPQQEAIYMIQKDITSNGLGDVIEIKGKENIVEYLKENFKDNNSELDRELSEIVSALDNKTNTNLSGIMSKLRKNLNNRDLGYHIYTTIPSTKSQTPGKTLKAIEQEGKAITQTLEILEDSAMSEEELNGIVQRINEANNPSEEVDTNDSNENNTKEENKANTQTNQTEEENTTPNQETKQDNSKDIKEQTTDVHSTNNNKWSYLTNVTKSPLVLNIGRRAYLFSSVEHAYQSLKHNDFSKPRSQWTIAQVYNKDWSNSKKIKSELKENRENDSNIKIMKYLLEERAKQDSKFKELLKETGNATLTHNKDNTIWKSEFPKLLMGIRDNLNNENRQENSNKVQRILDKASRDTKVNEEFKQEELEEIYNRGEGVDMDEEFVTWATPKTLDEAGQQIKDNAEKLIKNVQGKRDEKIENIQNKDKQKAEEQKAKAREEALDLGKILKPKDNPRSQLGLSVYENSGNEQVKNFYNNISVALRDYFGIKWNNKAINSLITFFENIGNSPYISSLNEGTSNISPIFLYNRARMSGVFRALDALVDFRFNNQDWTKLKEKYPNLKNSWEVSKEYRDYVSRGIPVSSLARDIGKKMLSDVGLTINEESATLGHEAAIHQELGMVAIEALRSIGLVQTENVLLDSIYNGIENKNAKEARVILNLDNIFKNDGNISKAMEFINDLSKKLNLDNSNQVDTYSTEPFTTDRIVKTKKGVFAMPNKMYEAIAAFLNTPFVIENSNKVSEFIADNEKALKTFLGYKDISGYVNDRDLKAGISPTDFYDKTGVFYSNIDSILGKNRQVEEDISYLKELLEAKDSEGNSIAEKGIYFNKTFSAGRLWIQSSTVNPQSKKLHRFLVSLKTQTRGEKLKNRELSDSTYVAIAQAFGYKTDKKTEAINIGKAIVETNGLREKVIKSLENKGEIELDNGTKLEIEEIGHTLNALFNIEAFKEAKEKDPNITSFTHNIIAEVDGINNGIALKGLTFFASPKGFNTLLSTGISFFGELKNKVMTQLFDAPSATNGKANPDKVYDTYELFAINTSKSFKRFYNAINKEYSKEEVDKAREIENRYLNDKNSISKEEKEILDEFNTRFEIENSVEKLSKELVKKDVKVEEFTPRVKPVVAKFSEALTAMNNLVFVENTNESVIESVSKEARSTNKYIVIPASYGSGVKANARSLTTYVMDNLKDWMLEYVDMPSKDIDIQKAFQNTSKYKMVMAIFEALELSGVTLEYRNHNGNIVSIPFSQGMRNNKESRNEHFKNIKNLILNSKESIGDIVVKDRNRASKGKVESLYEFVDRYMGVITTEAVRKSRDELLPGYEPINNSINSIHNSFAIVLNAKYNKKAFEILESRGVKINKEEGVPTELLTIAEHKSIMKELRKDFPSITVDSKERFGENKEKRHVGKLSTVNIQSKSSPTKSAVYIPGIGKANTGSKTITTSYERVEFGSVGATPTANMTQQNDGSDMIDLLLEGRNKDGQIKQNNIFDAVTLNPAEYADSKTSIISKYNENQINRGLNSSQLYEQTALAAKAARDLSEVDESFLSASDLVTKGFNNNSLELSSEKSIKEVLQAYYNNLAATMHSYYTISEVNKAIVKQLEIIGSNMQNGEQSDKAIISPKRIDLATLIKNKGFNVREYISDNLMIDITSDEISTRIANIENYLNSIYDNRVSNNTRKIDNDMSIETLNKEVGALKDLIENKIESIKNNLLDLGATSFANDLDKYIKPLGEGALSLEAKRENGRDVYQDIEGVDKDKIDREAKDETVSSNIPAKNKDTKEANTKPTKESKPKDSNVESEGEKSVIERLTEALEKILEPNNKKDRAIEAINQGKAKENTPDGVEKAKNKINDILKVGFNKNIDLRKLGKNKEGFTKLVEQFKEKLENFNVDEYLQDKTKYLENMFKDIVGKDSIFDKINKEVLKSFENVDDTTVSDTSMDEFVSQIDLTTDKVSTTQEQMRSIDESNGRAMSKEFSTHLKGVLSELSSLSSEAVNGVKVKYFKSKGKGHNEGEFLTQLREILIKEGIPLSKANYTGVASLEETYSHELLHAITYYVIKAQKGSNPLTRELSMLHKRYLSVMTPSKLAKFINSGVESKDLEVANRIMSHFESNTIEGLAEFIAIALSNEAVWNSLKDIEVKSEPNYDAMTFGERVVAKAMNMFNTFFNSIYRKYQDSDSMQKAMIALATKIAAANSKAEYKIDKENDLDLLESADTLTTISRGLASGLDKMDEIGSEKLNKLKDYIKSSGVKLVSVPKSRRRKYNSRWEEIRGLVAILASDVAKDKAAQAALSVAHDIGLHYNGITQYIVSELSQMSDMKRKAEYFSRKRKVLDSNRAGEIKANTEVLEEYFNTPLTIAENQALGEGMLDTDLSSLLDHYSIDELPDILNNTQSYKEKAYSDMLKEVDKNFKEKVGKYPKDDYKRYITNQANSLAYFMNFQSYRNEVEGAIGVKNPTMIAMMVGTGANIKPNKNVVSAIDKYVTLAALEYLESDVKELIINKLQTEPKGMEAMINYHRTNKAESLAKNFGGNPALMIKGYRYDVVEDYIDIKIAPISEEGLLKSQGFRRVSKDPLRKSPDDNSEERYIYVNDFVSSTASFNQQAVSYLGHTGRGSKLSDIYNDKILKGSDVKAVEQEWYDSIVQLTKNSSLAARKLMSPNYSPANFKDKNDSENTMVPIFDENGNLRDFAYLMSKKTKKDLLGLDTSLTKSLSHMNARMMDKYEAQTLNKVVADTLFEDYDNANEAERRYHFVEMSFESKDPYIKEIYKMLEPSFKNYLEEKFDGKIMVRASTMLNFFGQRDMDYRNTANYRDKDVPYKKLLLGSMDVARQLAKLSKMEIVLRFGSTIYNNVISNSVTLLIRGVPMTQIIKDQIEGGRLLNKYLKDTKELKKLEAKKKAGGDVRDVEIENLKRELDRNPIKDMMDFGLFTTIQTFEDISLEDKDNSYTARQVRKYTVENENLSEGVRELMQKGFDIAFVTDKTVIGRGLTKFVQMGDFVARYALFKHYMRDGKMDKKEALEKVSDEFINYDLPVNKVIKFANDYGFLFFTRYAIVSQKVMAMLASDRPVSASTVVGLQALFNIDFADIFDGNFFTKNLGGLVSNPFRNLFNVLSPTGYDLVKGAYNRL